MDWPATEDAQCRLSIGGFDHFYAHDGPMFLLFEGDHSNITPLIKTTQRFCQWIQRLYWPFHDASTQVSDVHLYTGSSTGHYR